MEAFRMFHELGVAPPVNVKFVIEGEEEVGSPNLDKWLADNNGDLGADVAVISDTALAGPDRPSIVIGLRGLVYTEIEVTGPARDLHSGQYGGAVLNPIHALARIVAALHDGDGRITIPGFYDSVRVLSDEERATIASAPFDAAAHARTTGEAGSWGEAGYTVRERLGARPTLDANGIWGGWTGAGAKTVIPSKAFAKISMRLIPNQEPDEIFEKFAAHVRALAPAGVKVEVRLLNQGRACLVDTNLPAMRSARAAYAEVFGVEPVYMLEGGSIPVVASLAEILDVSTVLMGFGLPDDNLHAPDEHYALENYYRGIETAIAFYEHLGGSAG
jgi:acetylornithine deacetylase/succinyl-diaminopimelate desuccinylase-like protein